MVLSLRYRDLGTVISETRALATTLDQYGDDLTTRVRNRMQSVEGGMNATLNNADFFARQKIQQLRTRATNARTLATRVQTLRDTAKRVDSAVRREIETNRERLFNRNPHLRPSDPGRLERLWNWGRDRIVAIGDALGTLVNVIRDAWEWLGDSVIGRIIRTIIRVVAAVIIVVLCVLLFKLLVGPIIVFLFKKVAATKLIAAIAKSKSFAFVKKTVTTTKKVLGWFGKANTALDTVSYIATGNRISFTKMLEDISPGLATVLNVTLFLSSIASIGELSIDWKWNWKNVGSFAKDSYSVGKDSYNVLDDTIRRQNLVPAH